MSDMLGVPVTGAGQPEEFDGVGYIAMCGTNSIAPLFFKEWVKSGMHLSSIKKPEI